MLRGRRPLSVLGIAIAVEGAALGVGCSRKDPPAPAATLAAIVDAAPIPLAPTAPPEEAQDAAPAPGPRSYKVVLHTGDSTVGGGHGLARALKARFEAEGARYISDTVNSASLLGSDAAHHIGESVEKHQPDLVLINLGTNEVFVPAPQALEPRIRAIVKKVGPRDCIWIGPPTWKGDKGIVQVIRDNAAPCRFFDSSNMNLERINDGIHPTDKGGEEWGARFWAFFRPI